MSDSDNKRIAKNSGLLYIRMLFTMFLNLYSTRLIMQNLGVTDYGIYGVVGSVVSMFSILNSGITKAIQRYITYELGKPEGDVNKVFCSLLNVTFVFSVVTFAILEIIGLWFLNTYINIPQDSWDDAFLAYQFSVIASIFSLVSNPYNALIIAHEKMSAFAFITVVECVLKFGVAYFLCFFSSSLLFWYALGLLLVSVGVRLFYQIYSRIKFPESKYRFVFDMKLLVDVGRFTGFATLDGGLNVIAWKSIIWIVNICFGPAVNASYAIGNQVKNSVLGFAQNIQKAIDPQLTKSYAAGDYERHKSLLFIGSKVQVFLILIIVIPLFIRTEQIMTIWLGVDQPPLLSSFVRITIMESLILACFEVVRTSVMATGDIKKFVLIPNLIFLFVVPIMYVVGTVTENPIASMLALLSVYVIAYSVRLMIASRQCVFGLREFIKKSIFPSLCVFCISFILLYFLNMYINETFVGLVLFLSASVVIVVMISFFVGCDVYERTYIRNFLYFFYKKIACKWTKDKD